jgi:hypothetical protein
LLAGEDVMRVKLRTLLAACCLVAILAAGMQSTHAQGVMRLGSAGTIALKSGESVEIGHLYFVAACQSILKSPPEVEILDGPPQVTASVRAEMVLPRWQNCSKSVPGGTLILTAKDIEDPSFSHLTIRVLYKTKDGDRKWSEVLNLQLLP